MSDAPAQCQLLGEYTHRYGGDAGDHGICTDDTDQGDSGLDRTTENRDSESYRCQSTDQGCQPSPPWQASERQPVNQLL